MPISPEEVRATLEAGRRAAAEALRHAADQLEAVPLDRAAEALAWLETQLESFLREAERAFRSDPDAT